MNEEERVLEAHQSELMTAALDPSLLGTPYKVQTKWHVMTGAISCGKTTLINMLAAKGYQTSPEVSRPYIEQEVAKGRKIEEIFSSQEDERALTELQRQSELALPPEEVVFLDSSPAACKARSAPYSCPARSRPSRMVNLTATP